VCVDTPNLMEVSHGLLRAPRSDRHSMARSAPARSCAVTVDVTGGFLSARVADDWSPRLALEGINFSLVSGPDFRFDLFSSPLFTPPILSRLGDPVDMSGRATLRTAALDVLVFEGVSYRASGTLQMVAPLVTTTPTARSRRPLP